MLMGYVHGWRVGLVDLTRNHTGRIERMTTLTLPPGEPAAGPWAPLSLDDLATRLLQIADPAPGRPAVIAIDGRGASGKSTLAGELSRRVPGSVVVATDDLAWHEPLFGWGRLLRELLEGLAGGGGVRMSPPQWAAHGREGAIELPGGLAAVFVEGTGASPRDLAPLIDATVWVQADFADAERRGIARDLASGVNGQTEEEATRFWHWWMDAELAFFARERPWERADLIVAGTPVVPLGAGQVAVAPALPAKQTNA